MAFSGLTDVDAAVRAAKQLRTQSTTITSLSGAISGIISRLHGAGWVGGDATQFATNDWPKARKQFATLAEAVTHLADELDRQIAEQAEASKADADLAPTGGGLPAGPSPDGDPTPSPTPEADQPVEGEWADYLRTTLSEELSAQEIEDLINQIDQAPEPYRSLFMEHYDEFSYKQDTSGFYNPVFDSIHLDFTTDANDPRGPFYTVLHEFGHGIDDKEKWFGMETGSYEIDGQNLYETLRADVEADLTNTVTQYSTDPDQRARVVDAIMNRTTDQLSADDAQVLADLQGYYSTALAGANANVASDIYGGITNNVIMGDYGHRDDPYYWYGLFGNPTGAQAEEFFAGFYAEQMMPSGPDSTLSQYFPNSTAFCEQMAQDMADS
ncbi:MAG: hypothetical protein LBR19_00950 [Bifidobacteriaceae bacterium]|jgi:hypothetical protein|nr:hypothetical protein [Bifidobacteriaceae bacterium]